MPPSVPQVVLSTNHARAGVPDCEDAVYHPAMTALKWTAAALVALLASPAFAYHDTLGGGASIAGGALIGVILPIVVVVVLLMVGVGIWGRKKRKTKSKRRKRRQGR